MHKNLITSAIIILVLGIGGAYLYTHSSKTAEAPAFEFTINGQPINLDHGRSETEAAPGSATKVVTEYFGNEAVGDLNGDGQPDLAFLVTQTTGGSGTFYYVVGAITTPTGIKGTEAVLIGDRIAPQTTEIQDGKLIVNYADRASGEPMTTQPSIGKSLVLKLDPTTLQFGEVVQNFEGESR